MFCFLVFLMQVINKKYAFDINVYVEKKNPDTDWIVGTANVFAPY